MIFNIILYFIFCFYNIVLFSYYNLIFLYFNIIKFCKPLILKRINFCKLKNFKNKNTIHKLIIFSNKDKKNNIKILTI